jgi:hypothetical protein
MCAHLAEVDALPQEVPGYILEGFTQCLVVEFKEIHKLLNTAKKVHQMQPVSGKRDINTTLVAVQNLCSKANDVFHSLNLTKKWNISQGYWVNAFGSICYNCGAPDHTSNKCPLPRNEPKITKAKDICAKSVTEGRGSSGHGSGHGRGCGDGCGGRGGDHTNTRGEWGTNKGDPSTPGTSTSLGDGVEKQNGKWMMNCKSCQWNETHTSWFHGKWNCNQSTFCIPATHVFWGKLGTTPSAKKGLASAASTSTASSGVFRGQLSGLINRYKTEADDGAFASFLSDSKDC